MLPRIKLNWFLKVFLLTSLGHMQKSWWVSNKSICLNQKHSESQCPERKAETTLNILSREGLNAKGCIQKHWRGWREGCKPETRKWLVTLTMELWNQGSAGRITLSAVFSSPTSAFHSYSWKPTWEESLGSEVFKHPFPCDADKYWERCWVSTDRVRHKTKLHILV